MRETRPSLNYSNRDERRHHIPMQRRSPSPRRRALLISGRRASAGVVLDLRPRRTRHPHPP
jgi:hypothetical protein